MTDFRASLSHTLSGSLQAAEDRETNIDRVAAFGTCTRLGTLLWRVKYYLDGSALHPAIVKLAETAGITPQIAELAIHEYLDHSCRACKGARELNIDKKRVVCSRCGGTGLHRASDRERAAYLRISIGAVKQYGKAITKAHATIVEHDSKVNSRMNRELER